MNDREALRLADPARRIPAAIRDSGDEQLLQEILATEPDSPASAVLVAAAPVYRRRDMRRVAITGIVAIAVVAGTIAVIHATAASTPAPASSSTPVLAPQQPFDGDCPSLLPSAEAAAVTGEALEGSRDQDVPLQLAGGLSCTWQSSKVGRFGALIQLVAAPSELRTAPSATKCIPRDFGGGRQWSCPVDLVAGSTWIDGRLTAAPGATVARARTLADRLQQAIEGRDGDAVLPARPSNAWRATTCTAFAGRTLETALARSALSIDPEKAEPTPLAPQTAARAWSHATECRVEQTAKATPEVLEFQAFPAGAWLQEEAAQNRAEPLRSSNTVKILATTSPGGDGPSGRTIWATDGPNLLRITSLVPLTDTQVRATVTAILKELDTP